MTIEGNVARVLTARTLVINRGAEHGVKQGMYFAVLDDRGANIEDPVTGEKLGSILRPKVYVQVSEVQDKLCVASTFRKTRVNLGGSGGGAVLDLSRYFMPPNWVERYQTFKTDAAAWEEIDEKESVVKTGDPVREVTEAEAVE